MSVSVLSGDITIYFTNDTGGDKQIRWTGSAATSATRTVNEVYSAVMDVFDNVTGGAGDYMSEGVPFRAITPTSYQIGEIETNDNEPWFIDPLTIEHLTGGGISTVGWTRVPGSVIGVVRVQCSSTGFNLTSSDVGDTITHADGDAGRILYVDTVNFQVWIRPDSELAANNFDSTSGTLTATTSTNTATQTAASVTGNWEWVNLFTIGSIVSGTQIYVARNQIVFPNFFPTGPVDRLFPIREFGTFIDGGYLTVYARLVNTTYDNFVSDASGGGRIAIPLAAQNDLNNQTIGAIAANGIAVGYAGPYVSDVNDDTINENYSIQLNCAGNPLSYVYEYVKYITRRGSTTPLNGLAGEQYVGIDYKIEYTGGVTGTVSIGNEVTGSISGATGFVTNLNTTASPTYVMLNNSQGTFVTGENLTIGGNSINTTSLVTSVTPTKASPLGTFAGGRFFGATGVYLTNVPGADLNNYQVIADDLVTYQEPIQVSFTLTGIQTDSEIRIYNNDITNSRDTEITGTESSASTLRSVVIQNGGTGYTVNDTLTLVGGTFTTAATLTVDSVDGGGSITGVTILNPGEGYTQEPGAPTSVTGGTGTGAAFIGTYRGDFTYTYVYTTDINITIVIFNLFAKDIRLLGLQLTDQNQSIPIQQIVERNYLVGSV
jgi:hypothetical protein